MRYVTIVLLSFLLTVLFSCNSNDQKADPALNKKAAISVNDSTFSDFAKRNVESALKISTSEQYDFQIKKAYINRDTLKDAVILINRKEHALEKAKRDGNLKFLEKMGYTGLHNHVFVFLGGTNELLQTAPVGSNIDYPLNVFFESLSKPSHTDFYVEYRNRNSLYRNYYTVRGNKIYLTLNCPVFDLIGEKEPKAYAIKHKESKVRTAKDIAIFEGSIANYDPDEIENVNNYYPDSITTSNDLIVYFIYDEKTNAYVTPMRPDE